MNTKLAGYDETVVCPYNSSHIILKERIQTHLVKCARSHPNIKLDTCPFNVTHRYRPEHKARHLEECTSRESFDRYAFEIENGPSSSQSGANKFVKPRAPPPQIQNDEEENWDHYDAPTYNPQEYAANAKVLRNPTLLTPSERRKFADNERKRLSELDRRQPQN